MSSTDDPVGRPIAELAVDIRDRRISPVDLVQAFLNRIERLEPSLHAYLEVTGAGALREAQKAEREVAAGRWRGPLHGIPFAVKDLIDTRGVATTCASLIHRDRIPVEDATVVARLRNAGAVLLGKLVMTEFAGIGYHPSVTPPSNPWNPHRWTGQSSSGSGVAVAARLCAFSLGSDTGGSLRYPASACGVVGLRPSYGRVSRAGTFPLAESLDAIGPITGCVTDAALVLGVIAGEDPDDVTSLRDAVPDFVAASRRVPADRPRIGVLQALVDAAEGPVREAVDAAVARYGASGIACEPVELLGLDEAVGAWAHIFTSECLLAHEAFFPARADDYSEALRRFLVEGAAVRGIDYARASMVRAKLARQIDELLDRRSVLLLPTMGRLPPPLDEFPADGIIPAASAGALLRYTAPFALTGHPAISIPCGSSPEGLPIGLQLVGRRCGEGALLGLARMFEAGTHWHRLRPPSTV